MKSGKHLEQKCLGALQTKWNCWNWEGFLFYLWWRISFMASSAVDSSLETSARWFRWKDLERSSGISKKRCGMFLGFSKEEFHDPQESNVAGYTTESKLGIMLWWLAAVFTICSFHEKMDMMIERRWNWWRVMKKVFHEEQMRADLMDTQEIKIAWQQWYRVCWQWYWNR